MFVAGVDAHATYSVIAIVSNTGQLVEGPVRIKRLPMVSWTVYFVASRSAAYIIDKRSHSRSRWLPFS